VLAALVLSERGDPVVGLARGGLGREPCLELVGRRRRIFSVPLDDDAGGERPALDALGFTLRAAVTGERAVWCFGAELLGDERQTLWIVTERGAAQGLGWACLTALARGLTRNEHVRGPR
jgi:hypothetical protein